MIMNCIFPGFLPSTNSCPFWLYHPCHQPTPTWQLWLGYENNLMSLMNMLNTYPILILHIIIIIIIMLLMPWVLMPRIHSIELWSPYSIQVGFQWRQWSQDHHTDPSHRRHGWSPRPQRADHPTDVSLQSESLLVWSTDFVKSVGEEGWRGFT